jgi:hypothetical protein
VALLRLVVPAVAQQRAEASGAVVGQRRAQLLLAHCQPDLNGVHAREGQAVGEHLVRARARVRVRVGVGVRVRVRVGVRF